jgi:hypothetical protein
VIERRRDHRILEGGHDHRPGLAGADAGVRGLDLVSAVERDADDVAERERRREVRLCLYPRRHSQSGGGSKRQRADADRFHYRPPW